MLLSSNQNQDSFNYWPESLKAIYHYIFIRRIKSVIFSIEKERYLRWNRVNYSTICSLKFAGNVDVQFL